MQWFHKGTQIIQTLQINVHKSNNEIYNFLLMSASFPHLTNPDSLTNLPPYSDTLTPFKARTGFFPTCSSNFSAYVKGTVSYMRVEASGEGCCLWTHLTLILDCNHFNNNTIFSSIALHNIQNSLGKCFFFLSGQHWKQENKLSHQTQLLVTAKEWLIIILHP